MQQLSNNSSDDKDVVATGGAWVGGKEWGGIGREGWEEVRVRGRGRGERPRYT